MVADEMSPVRLLSGPAATGLPWPPSLTPMAFPFVYPGAYSRPQRLANYAYGWIHSPDPVVPINGNAVQYDQAGQALTYLQNINHNPLDTGDNLQIPVSGLADSADLVGFSDLAGNPDHSSGLTPPSR